jgi:hypothetical protein
MLLLLRLVGGVLMLEHELGLDFELESEFEPGLLGFELGLLGLDILTRRG